MTCSKAANETIFSELRRNLDMVSKVHIHIRKFSTDRMRSTIFSKECGPRKIFRSKENFLKCICTLTLKANYSYLNVVLYILDEHY